MLIRVDVDSADSPVRFDWKSMVLSHPEAAKIIGPGIIKMEARFMDSHDPNWKNPNANLPVPNRLDFVAWRSDGSFCRLHPDKNSWRQAWVGDLGAWTTQPFVRPFTGEDMATSATEQRRRCNTDAPAGPDLSSAGAASSQNTVAESSDEAPSGTRPGFGIETYRRFGRLNPDVVPFVPTQSDAMSSKTAYELLKGLLPSPEENPSFFATDDIYAKSVDLTAQHRFPWRAFLRSFEAGREILNFQPDYCYVYWNHHTSERCLWVGNANVRESCHVVYVTPNGARCQRL